MIKHLHEKCNKCEICGDGIPVNKNKMDEFMKYIDTNNIRNDTEE